MRKFKRIGKASVLIIGIVAVLALAVYGFISIIKNIVNTDNEPAETTNTSSPVVSSGPVTESPLPEDVVNIPTKETVREIKVSFSNDRFIIENSGRDTIYSNTTGVNLLSIYVPDSICLESGYYEVQGSEFMNGYTISEEKDGILINARLNRTFNMIDTSDEDSLILGIIKPLNESVMVYRNDLSRTYMTIESARLSKESDSFVKRYTETYDSTNSIYTIEIATSRMPELKDEHLIYNDGIIKSIKITNEGNTLRMEFETYGETIIYPNTRGFEAAITFIPVKEHEKKLIVIDPGHGGIDGGTTNADVTILEKDIVIEMGRYLAEDLAEMGYEVVNIREEDIYVGLMERTDIANLTKADAIISVHVNAYDYDHVKGAITMYKTSERLAQSIQDSIVSSIGANDMGIQKYTNMSILNRAEMESVIVETGFITNEEDLAKLVTADYQKKMARAIADGVNNFYNGGN